MAFGSLANCLYRDERGNIQNDGEKLLQLSLRLQSEKRAKHWSPTVGFYCINYYTHPYCRKANLQLSEGG